ncbi:MAG: hypothetical protein COB36_11095 [Alphaproteobacteria bacterium]|nr:MAG: hypothetical protein COB36_11095 [Alphaproteobacteria bacterium]
MSFDTVSRCGCGETRKETALINLTVSKYRNVPTIEIDQNIGWLNQVKADCDFKISRLEQLKSERRRSQAWRDDINAIARQFFDMDALHLDNDTRTGIIKQRLGCDDKRARDLAEIVGRWAKNEKRKQRDELICYAHKVGFSAIKIAEQHDISRQQVHNVLKKSKVTFIKKTRP